jgi:hypothetical protein
MSWIANIGLPQHFLWLPSVLSMEYQNKCITANAATSWWSCQISTLRKQITFLLEQYLLILYLVLMGLGLLD